MDRRMGTTPTQYYLQDLFEHATARANPAGASIGARMGITRHTPTTISISVRPPSVDREIAEVYGEPATQLESPDSNAEKLFEEYALRTIRFPDAKPHPGRLCESAALAGVLAPMPSYRPHLPRYTVSEGIVSDVQIEAVTFIGEAHSHYIQTQGTDDGSPTSSFRQGFMLGDGAGAGKGRIIAATIVDRRAKGDDIALWVSQTDNLYKSTVRDLRELGADTRPVRKINDWKIDDEITMDQGVMYSTYASLRSRRKKTDAEGNPLKNDDGKPIYVRRIDQIVDYLGASFTGLLVLDESQNLARTREVDNGFWSTSSSLQGQVALELQSRLPNARVIYSSATALDRLDAVSYAPRLGLWGPDTQFPTRAKFLDSMAHGRTTALEIVCRHLKSKGLYLARQMSTEGVDTRNLIHRMTECQHQQMRDFNVAWRAVTLGVERALQSVGATERPEGKGKIGATKASDYVEATRSKLESAKQRFYIQALTSMKMPTVLTHARERLADGESVVIQMNNTYEAYLDYAINEATKDGVTDPRLMDRSCVGELVRFVNHDFPSKEVVVRVGDDGETVEEFVIDPLTGVPVENAEASMIRRSVSEAIRRLVPIDNHLDVLQAEFQDLFAEVTSRTKRVVTSPRGEMHIERRGPTASAREIEAFNNGDKRVLAFSKAGGVGEDYASNRNYKNRTRRNHMVIQIPERAIEAEQGLGRTNRTNQVHDPRYAIVTTDYPCEIRMAAPLARKMGDMGSLTRGDRAAGTNAYTSAIDIEGAYATKALRIVLERIAEGKVAGVDKDELYAQTGIDVITASNANKPKKKRTQNVATIRISIKQFLNRLMTADAGIDGGLQGRVVDLLIETMLELAEDDHIAGTSDAGAEYVHADTLRVETTEDLGQRSARARDVSLTRITRIDREPRMTYDQAVTLLRNRRNFEPTDRLSDFYSESGGMVSLQIYDPVTQTYAMHYPNRESDRREAHKSWTYTRIGTYGGTSRWKRETSESGDMVESTFHVVHGSLLNVWNDLEAATARPRSVRMTTEGGRRIDGCMLAENETARFLVEIDKPR